jgi:hypothetical protein
VPRGKISFEVLCCTVDILYMHCLLLYCTVCHGSRPPPLHPSVLWTRTYMKYSLSRRRSVCVLGTGIKEMRERWHRKQVVVGERDRVLIWELR